MKVCTKSIAISLSLACIKFYTYFCILQIESMDIKVMEQKLYDACLEGDVEMLKELMREDRLILAQLSISSCFNQTPLHLASMLGHFELAKSLLSYKPDFASRLDSQDRSPLHVASANGYANIVKLLLEYDQEMCRVRVRMEGPLFTWL